MKEAVDPSPSVYIRKMTILKTLLIACVFLIGLSILINLGELEQAQFKLKTLKENGLIQVENSVIGFIKEDLDNIEFEKIQQLKLMPEISPKIYESIIEYECSKLGCNAATIIRVMYCESRGNPYAENDVFIGLFQHHKNYWPARAKRYGVSGSSIHDPYAQIHITTRMFSEGLSYLWGCK